jgi:protein phosphatase
MELYDIIGDVHGCASELDELLIKLGYIWDSQTGIFAHPGGRTVVFVGDLVDRGPDSASVLALAMNMVEEHQAIVVLGNHDDKLKRALIGNKVKMNDSLKETMRQIASRGHTFGARVIAFIAAQRFKVILHDSRLLVCHAGLPEKYHDKEHEAARAFCLYGETNGTFDKDGYPVRLDWAASYSGSRIVVHGHVPVISPVIKNNVWNIDTGCCFGGHLTALRYPEMEIVQVEAYEAYSIRKGLND